MVSESSLVNLPIMDEWMDGCEVGGTWHCILWIRRYGVPRCFLFVVFIPQGKGNTDGQYGDVLCDVGDKTWFSIQEIKAWRVALPLAGSALMNLFFYILSSTQPEKISKETPRQRIVTLTHWQLWKFMKIQNTFCTLFSVYGFKSMLFSAMCTPCIVQCVHHAESNEFISNLTDSIITPFFCVYSAACMYICIYIIYIYILIFVECFWNHPVLHS